MAWMFHKKGDIVIPKSAAKEDDLMNLVLEAGGDDLKDDGENWEILTEPSPTKPFWKRSRKPASP